MRGQVPRFTDDEVKQTFASNYSQLVLNHVGASCESLTSRTREELQDWILQHTHVDHFPSYIDQNRKLTLSASGGDDDCFDTVSYVWKAANSCESPSILDAEAAVMHRLNLCDELGSLIPKCFTNDDGNTWRYETCGAGTKHLVRLISFLPGKVFAKCRNGQKQNPKTLQSLGRGLGLIDAQLKGLRIHATVRFLRWDLKAADHISTLVPFCIKEDARRIRIESWMQGFEELVKPALAALPVQVLYGDANDYNLLVEECDDTHLVVSGILDFGDIVMSPAVCDLAIALAYFLMCHSDLEGILMSAMYTVEAYHHEHPLSSRELCILWHLIAARLCTSIVISAYEAALQPENHEYCEISLKPACDLLLAMSLIAPWDAAEALHVACNVEKDEEMFDQLRAATNGLKAAAGRPPPNMAAVFKAWGRFKGMGPPLPSPGQASRNSSPAVSPRLPPAPAPVPEPTHTVEEILNFRDKHCAKTLSVQFRSSPSGPLKITKGEGSRLITEDGTPYLDCVNNVCHVGHCQHDVVEAAVDQMRKLNTNTRFLSDTLVNYTSELLETFPPELGLDTVFFTNSGTEANDLAYRLATAHTKRSHMLVVDHAYHGHSKALIDISPYKFKDQGQLPTPPQTSFVAMPDVYRGKYNVTHVVDGPERAAEEALLATRYADEVEEKLQELKSEHKHVAAFWAESLMGVGGQVIPPDGWLDQCHKHARKHGALCIADEVQVGFGRVGTHWWAFQCQGGAVAPDIVTLGKPIGNGHPMAAVVCKKAIADSFAATGLEYFATFGGNPVSCVTGSAVLRVVREQKLMENALTTGQYFLSRLKSMRKKHPELGDVRGKGLFVGVDLVENPETREPWALAPTLSNAMKEKGVIITTDGPYNNVLKIKPPIVFDDSCVDVFCAALDEVLTEVKNQHA